MTSGRPRPSRPSRPSRRLALLAGVLIVAATAPGAVPAAAGGYPATDRPVAAGPDATDGPAGAGGPGGADPLVLAHYYIWFTPGSWARAKTDLPLNGTYSSDDAEIMRQQVRQAKRVGIDGFIVSWKHTDALTPRLAALTRIAAQEHFKLALTYQGLDFNRVPLPVEQITADLSWFSGTYGNDPVFDIFGKPLVVLTGTPALTPEEVAAIAAPTRGRLLLLASEKNSDGYERIASFVDGNLYYWSSVDPGTYQAYDEKLAGLGSVVHAHGGLWIAPAAPGFDARLVGGSSVVERRGGQTLRREWAAAAASDPDAIGLISWNEFSENTHVEPSRNFGYEYLQVVADLAGAPPLPGDLDSSEPSAAGSPLRSVLSLGGLAAVFILSLVTLMRRKGSLVRTEERA